MQRSERTPVASGSICRRLGWLLACLGAGLIVGAAGSALTTDSHWYLAIPAAVAAGWLFVANPASCEPSADRFVAAQAFGCVLGAASGLAAGADRAPGGSAPGTELRCAALNVSVRSADSVGAKLACDGARDAIRFLEAQGFAVDGEVRIDLVPEVPRAAGSSALGCYLEPEQRVAVLMYSEFTRLRVWLDLPAEAALYRSLVAHEATHAIGACNFKIAAPSIQAKEYIACVTMLATMAPALRERLLSQFPGRGFEGEWQMGTDIYLLDPVRFGVQAYRHFLKPDNGREYLHAILAGKVLVE